MVPSKIPPGLYSLAIPDDPHEPVCETGDLSSGKAVVMKGFLISIDVKSVDETLTGTPDSPLVATDDG